MPDEHIQQLLAGQAAPSAFEVWPENWPAFIAFTECSTQWRWLLGAKRAVRTGLDYGGVGAVLDSLPWITDRAQAMADIRIMERAVLEVFSEGE